MLTEAEKLSKRDDFIKSEKFGSSVYLILMTFRLNVRGILSTIRVYGDLIEKLDDKSFIKHTMSDDEVIKIKQYVMLNVISWLMSLIESLFVLTHSLSSSYLEVNENMTHYRNSLFWDIRRNIQSRKYDLQKVLALPDVTTLNLTIDEQSLLKRTYEETIKNIYLTLDELAAFYEKYNIIYNKSKHGLIFFPGGFSQQEEKRLSTSSLSAYDRRPEGKMPSGYFKATQQEEYQKWLNVETHLNFNQALFQQVGTLVNYLEKLSTYIVDCNLNFANNCGEGFLPYRMLAPNQVSLYFFPDRDLTDEERKIADSIQAKIFPEMVVSNYAINIQHRFTKDSLIKSVAEQPITNVFLIPKNLEIKKDS